MPEGKRLSFDCGLLIGSCIAPIEIRLQLQSGCRPCIGRRYGSRSSLIICGLPVRR